MGNKIFKNEEELLCAFIKSTNSDNEGKMLLKKPIFIENYTDFPKYCLKTLKKEKITEKELIEDDRLHIMCRLLSYEHRKFFICKNYQPNKLKYSKEETNLRQSSSAIKLFSINTKEESELEEGKTNYLNSHLFRQSMNDIHQEFKLNRNEISDTRILFSKSIDAFKNPRKKKFKKSNFELDWNLPFGVWCKFSFFSNIFFHRMEN